MKYNFQKPIKEISPPPRPPNDKVSELLESADRLGHLLQNKQLGTTQTHFCKTKASYLGFLPNDRQQRAAGCAAIELAQAMLKDVEARRRGESGWKVSTKGASGGGGKDGTHYFHWRDAMDIIVKWRQLSEPNDQVLYLLFSF